MTGNSSQPTDTTHSAICDEFDGNSGLPNSTRQLSVTYLLRGTTQLSVTYVPNSTRQMYLLEQLSAKRHNTAVCDLFDGSAAGLPSGTGQLSVTYMTENDPQPTDTTHSAICHEYGTAVHQVALDSYL